jgi:phytoene dehydrogenase-like protein
MFYKGDVRMAMKDRPPVIVVGGGLSGLSTAAILARAGHALTLFEKASAPGGRGRTKQHGEFFFNQGAHAAYLGGIGEKLLHELGVRYSGSQPVSNNFLALDGGQLHTLPADVPSMFRTTLLGLGDKVELARIFTTLKRMKLADFHRVSWQDWLEQQVRHVQVRKFLLAAARLATYSNAPDLLPVSVMPPFLDAKALYLDGGWQTLVDGLRQVALEAGVQIMTQARVTAVEVADAGHAVRLADGTLHPAAAVVLAVDPQTASTLVADGRHEILSQWAAQSIPALVTCFDVALRRLPQPKHLFALGIDRPLYYSLHSAWAKLAPEGGALIHTARYLKLGESPAPESVRQELEALLDRLQPGWREEVVEQYFLPHMVVSNAVVQADQGGLPGRPGPAVPGIANLYVVGDWVGAEGLLAEACFASTQKAAKMIMATLAAQRDNYAVVNR